MDIDAIEFKFYKEPPQNINKTFVKFNFLTVVWNLLINILYLKTLN